MCFWGIALTAGSNYNSPTNAGRERVAYEAIQQARTLANGTTERERWTIGALARRHAPSAGADRLGALIPGAGHIVHMPSHVFRR
jgi:hypothetical protein